LQAIILKRKKLEYLANYKSAVVVILTIVFTSILLSEYSIFSHIHPVIFLLISVTIISIYASSKGILNRSIFIKN
jgi:uncharacterized membrane protein